MIIFSFISCFKESQDGGYSEDVLFLVYALIVYVTSLIFYRKKKEAKLYHTNGK